MAVETATPSAIDIVNRRERRSAVVAVMVAVIIVGAAIGFLAYTYQTLREWSGQLTVVKSELADRQGQLTAAIETRDQAKAQLEQATTQLASARTELEDAKTRLGVAKAQMTALEEQIRLSVGFAQHLHAVDLEDAKLLSVKSDRLANLLERILELQQRKTGFSSANKPEIGFNSPGFANYILNEIEPGKTLENLPSTDNPKLGDVIRYAGGFAMFLLEDAKGKQFVIGMTPGGIAALEPDFGVPRTGALSTALVSP